MVVVDESLAPGLAANAAAVMAMTLGAKLPDLIGADFEDGGRWRHPGLITAGLPVLRAPADELPALRARAVEAEVGVIGFPAFGPDDDRLRGVPGDGRRDDDAGLPRARVLRPGEACPARSREASGSLGVAE